MKKLIALLLIGLLATSAFASSERILTADKIRGIQTEKSYISGAAGDAELASAAAIYPGWTCTGTATVTRTTSSPLAGTGSLLFSAGAAEDYCYTAFTIDTQHKAKVLAASLEYDLSSGAFALGDVEAQIYDVTNSASVGIAPTDLDGLTSGAPSSPFMGEFQTNSNSTSYQLRLVRKAGTGVIRIDSISVGRKAKVFGAPVTDWQSYTPTFVSTDANLNLGATSSKYGKYRRVGDSIEVEFSVTTGGAGIAPGTGSYVLSLPSGVTVDSSKLTDASYAAAGTGWYYMGAPAGFNTFTVRYDSANSRVLFVSASGGYMGGAMPTGGFSSGGQVMNGIFTLPILGWSSSTQMSDSADTRVVAAKARVALSGAVPTGDTVVNFSTVDFDTHGAVTTGAGWKFTCPSPGKYRVSSAYSATNTSGVSALLKVTVNNVVIDAAYMGQSAAGQRYNPVISTIVNCNAGDYIQIKHGSNSAALTYDADANVTFVAIEKLSGPSQIAASDSNLARLRKNSGAHTANGAWQTVSSWDEASFSSHGSLNASTGIFTANSSGVYQVSANIGFVANATGHRGIDIYKNGAAEIDGTLVLSNGSVNGNNITAAGLVRLLAGETVSIAAYQNTGGNLNYDSGNLSRTTFSIVRVGNY